MRGRTLVRPEMTECKGERPAVVTLLSRNRGIEKPVIVIPPAYVRLGVRGGGNRNRKQTSDQHQS